MSRHPFLLLCALALTLRFTGPVSHAAPAPAEHDPEAVAVVDRIATFYKGVKVFSVIASSQVLRGPGVDVQAKRTYALTVQKPDKMVADLQGGAASVRMFIDGKTLTMFTDPPNEYRQAPAPASLGPFLQKMAPGLDTVIAEDPKLKIMEDVTKLSIVGEEKLEEVEYVRLRFVQPDATVDLLVQKGEKPLMRRLLLKTTDNRVLIQFDLTGWKFDPKLDGDPFTFTPPLDAKKVAPKGDASEP